MRRAVLCLLLLAAPGWAAEPKKSGCPCPGCECLSGGASQRYYVCPMVRGGKCEVCDANAYAKAWEEVKGGKELKLAVGVKAKAGEVQSPPIPNVKPGVYRWYAKDGVPTCDFIFVPSPTERNESYKNGDGVPRFPAAPMFFPPPNSPFTLPGCLPGKA